MRSDGGMSCPFSGSVDGTPPGHRRSLQARRSDCASDDRPAHRTEEPRIAHMPPLRRPRRKGGRRLTSSTARPNPTSLRASHREYRQQKRRPRWCIQTPLLTVVPSTEAQGHAGACGPTLLTVSAVAEAPGHAGACRLRPALGSLYDQVHNSRTVCDPRALQLSRLSALRYLPEGVRV